MISNKLVMPEHLNPAGNLFGGQMMAWMDKIAAMEAFDHTKRNCVTAKVSEINFLTPVELGDRVRFEAKVIREGKSSLQVRVKAERKKINVSEPIIEGYDKEAATAIFTFVALDEMGKPSDTWEHKLCVVEDTE